MRPGLDDKVLTEWNALLLATLAEAAAATGDAAWLAAAVANGEFLLAQLRRADGRWLRSWQADGRRPGAHLAYAADHAALVDAFTRLAEATGEARWIAEAAADAPTPCSTCFWDDDAGGLFTTGDDAEPLITRPEGPARQRHAVGQQPGRRRPAPPGRPHRRGRATPSRPTTILRLLGRARRPHPTAFAHLLAAVDLPPRRHHRGRRGRRPARPGAAPCTRRYLPNAVLAWGEPYDSPLWEGRRPTGRAYVCRDYACQAPVDDAEALVAQLSAALSR